MKKIKKNLSQPKNGINQLEFEADKEKVATTGATYIVKYLGYEEVKEARGVKVCSNAVTTLLKDKKHKKKMALKISMDGVRVVDDISRVLILDQPIEKISFCAHDSSHPKLFSYVARDGASRRWLCYGFYAVNDPGERLSHALGCAFAACLQKKQKSAKPSNDGSTGQGSSKENSPAIQKSAQPTIQTPAEPTIQRSSPAELTIKKPAQLTNPAVGRPHATTKRLQSKEITVPLPSNFTRDRSATAIGISTPPAAPPAADRVANPFGDNFEPPANTFTVDLADILLFDPHRNTDVLEQKPRAATDTAVNDIDEFDPLHPQFKSMQFDDDFVSTTHSFTLQHSSPSTNHITTTLQPNHFSNTNPFCVQPGQTFTATIEPVFTKTMPQDDFDMFASSRISQR